MRKVIGIIWVFAMIVIALILIGSVFASCSPRNQYWEHQKHTVTGRHTYYKAGWGASSHCPVYPEHLPTKKSYYKRLNQRP